MPPPKDPEKYKLWKERQSKSHIGYTHSEESKQKMSIKRLGKKLSEDHKLSISNGLSGRIRSESERKSISEARLRLNLTISDETKHKISIFMKGNQYRKGILFDQKTLNHLSIVHKQVYDNFSEEEKNKFRYSFLGKKHNQITIEKMSQSALLSWKTIDRFSRYKYTLNGRKTGIFNHQKCNGVVYYSSSYELKYLELISSDKSVISISRCPFSIPYIFENKNRSYWPDFLIETSTDKTIVEIKPEFFQSKEINVIKKIAAENFLHTRNLLYQIIGESKLKQLEIDLISLNQNK